MNNMQDIDRQKLFSQYPQLSIPISKGVSQSKLYKDIVLRGVPHNNMLSGDFVVNGVLGEYFDTPTGTVNIYVISKRTDFVHSLQALAHRCEPVEIPDSVGASTIRGLINWEKINRHKAEYLAAGGEAWSVEFRRFTADKSNYLDTIILLSSGYYSNISADFAGLSE